MQYLLTCPNILTIVDCLIMDQIGRAFAYLSNFGYKHSVAIQIFSGQFLKVQKLELNIWEVEVKSGSETTE